VHLAANRKQAMSINQIKRTFFAVVIILLLAVPVWAQDAEDNREITLSNNSGTGVSTWFITGEPSLVMNGFDLSPLSVNLPVSIRSVSIDVERATPGQPVQVVVYQDPRGGSPVDATLVSQTQVDIQQAGLYILTFPEPVEITAPVVWIGFYLPVDFEFRADTSGSSVLTYWAWQPGGTFDLSNLQSAGVFGPADGSAPVNLNIEGIARITAQLITDGSGTAPPTAPGSPAPGGVPLSDATIPRDEQGRPIRPLIGDPARVNIGVMVGYSPVCTDLYYDREDIVVTYRSNLAMHCNLDRPEFQPPSPTGFSRRGVVYNIYTFGASQVEQLPHAVTHCMRPPSSDIERALIGVAYGVPRQWHILPTVRYGELICAEIEYAGVLSYFVPQD
jgi:hypothetical protein